MCRIAIGHRRRRNGISSVPHCVFSFLPSSDYNVVTAGGCRASFQMPSAGLRCRQKVTIPWYEALTYKLQCDSCRLRNRLLPGPSSCSVSASVHDHISTTRSLSSVSICLEFAMAPRYHPAEFLCACCMTNSRIKKDSQSSRSLIQRHSLPVLTCQPNMVMVDLGSGTSSCFQPAAVCGGYDDKSASD